MVKKKFTHLWRLFLAWCHAQIQTTKIAPVQPENIDQTFPGLP